MDTQTIPVERWYGWKIDGAKDRYEEGRDEFVEAVSKDPSYAIQWNADEVLELQAMAQIEAEILRINESVGDLGDSVGKWAEGIERELTYAIRGGSRSTSTASNYVDDVRSSTRTRLYADYREFVRAQEEKGEG